MCSLGTHHELNFRAAGLKRQRDQMLADAQRSLDARTDALASLHSHEESLVEGGLQAALELVRASVGAELAERVATLEARRDQASGNAKPATVSTRSLRQKRLKSEGGVDEDEDDAGAADAGGAALGGALAALASAGAAASKNNDGPSGRRKRAQSPASMLLDKQLDEEEVRSDMYDIARDMQLLEHTSSAADGHGNSSGRSNGRSTNYSSSGSLPYKRPAPRAPAVAPQFRGNRVASSSFSQTSNGSYGAGSSLPGSDQSRRNASAHSSGNGQGSFSSGGPSTVKSQSTAVVPKATAAAGASSIPSSVSVAPGETLVVPNIKLGQVRCGADVFEKGDLVRALQAPPPEPKSASAKVKEIGSGSSGGNGKAAVASSVVGTVSSVNNSEVHLRLEDGSKHRIYLSHLRNRRTILKYA
jgi:hypothetical protein